MLDGKVVITDQSAADAVDQGRDAAIAGLLHECFGGVHSGRTFFKQMPAARILAWMGLDLVGHVGLEYRVVRAGQTLLSILGIIDLCVNSNARGHGIGAKLLHHAEQGAKGQSFVLAMADDARLYEQLGYSRLPSADVTFLAIDELRCQRVVERSLTDTFMVKPLSNRAWPEGSIDLLGYLF